jgi:hypothetical protein
MKERVYIETTFISLHTWRIKEGKTMADSDPIVDEIRRFREAHAARFNYDLRAIFNDIKEQEKRSGLKFVSFARDGSVISSTPASEVKPSQLPAASIVADGRPTHPNDPTSLAKP